MSRDTIDACRSYRRYRGNGTIDPKLLRSWVNAARIVDMPLDGSTASWRYARNVHYVLKRSLIDMPPYDDKNVTGACL